jgi:hypothetical protein
MPVRWTGAYAAGPGEESHIKALLQEWRRTLAKVEREAALHHCAEVHILVGTAGLAVEELIDNLAKTQRPEQSELQTDIP